MDSLTHIVLGAATGGAVLGRKAGNKALFWGALAGSVPDFDVAITSFYEPVKSLFVHRGFSHSIVFAIIVAPLLGWIISKIHKDIGFRQWTLMALIAILVHSTIDCFNTYGTALLEPFSGVRLAFDSIGIIDLVLLIPIIIIMIIAIFQPKFSNNRKVLSLVVLGYTMLFISFSVANKIIIESKIKKQITCQQIDYNNLKTAPLPLTNFLWLVLAEDSNGYHFGYYSNFDKDKISLKYIPRNEQLLGKLWGKHKVRELIRFTDGFYTVNKKNDGSLWLNDLRFGSMAFESEDDWYVFSFQINEIDKEVIVSRAHPNRSFGYKTFGLYWKRVFRDI
jgi:inner membrane protein